MSNQKGIRVEERGMAHSNDEITNGKEPSGSQTKKCVNEIFEKMFEDLNNSSIKSCTIFKVNVGLRESNPDAYTPKMVSIGPYHRKNPQLHPMEKYKLSYLQRFLKRNKERLDVKRCMSELKKLKEEVLKCYEDLDTDDSHEFCQMLLLDGCFVVEFIREHVGMCPRGEDEIIKSSISCIYDKILRDLLLLENQLPFFVLNQLHHMTKQDDELPLVIMAMLSFSRVFNLEYILTPEYVRKTFQFNVENINHLLQVVHIVSCTGNSMKNSTESCSCLCPSGKSLICLFKDNIPQYRIMPNAAELSEAGVRFTKEVGDMTNLFNIKFKNGLMTIPHIHVVNETEVVLRNLIAYEQQSFDVQPKYFSDYANFMDFLINSDKDVNLLSQKGIIENWLGEEKEVASLFNKIAYGFTMSEDFYYKEECVKADNHCKNPWNRMKANLKHNYFSSPWVGASTAAAIILLILTTIQTILAFTGSVK